jgi:hypothetical protein
MHASHAAHVWWQSLHKDAELQTGQAYPCVSSGTLDLHAVHVTWVFKRARSQSTQSPRSVDTHDEHTDTVHNVHDCAARLVSKHITHVLGGECGNDCDGIGIFASTLQKKSMNLEYCLIATVCDHKDEGSNLCSREYWSALVFKRLSMWSRRAAENSTSSP